MAQTLLAMAKIIFTLKKCGQASSGRRRSSKQSKWSKAVKQAVRMSSIGASRGAGAGAGRSRSLVSKVVLVGHRAGGGSFSWTQDEYDELERMENKRQYENKLNVEMKKVFPAKQKARALAHGMTKKGDSSERTR